MIGINRLAVVMGSLLAAANAAAYSPYVRVLGVTLPAPTGEGARLVRVVEGSSGFSLEVRLPVGADSRTEMRVGPVPTAGWAAERGIGLWLKPDGASRYVDFAVVDAATGETYRYAISTRDSTRHPLFIPFPLLTSDRKPFDPAQHAQVALAWIPQDKLDAAMTFDVSDISVGHLTPAEFAWPAAVPPFITLPDYLETFEGRGQFGVASGARVSAAGGPPAVGLPGAIVDLPNAASSVTWHFAALERWPIFDGMTIWYGSSPARVTFAIDVNASDRAGRHATYRHEFLADGQGWQVDHLEWDDFVDTTGKNFEPDEWVAVDFVLHPMPESTTPVRVMIGPFRLDDE